MKRYFLVTVCHSGGYCDRLIETDGKFPSKAEIADSIMDIDSHITVRSIVIINLYEFKSYSDFKDYKGLL